MTAEETKAEIDKRIGNRNYINKEFFYGFFQLLIDHNYQCDPQLVLDTVLDEEGIRKSDNSSPYNIFCGGEKLYSKTQSFYKYLKKHFDEHDEEYFKKFMEELFKYVNENSNDKQGFYQLFMEFVTLKCAQDIRAERVMLDKPKGNNVGNIVLKLGDLIIASMDVNIDGNFLYFQGLESLIKSQRHGSMLMQEFCKLAYELGPNYIVAGMGLEPWNVKAQKFYRRLGGQVFRQEALINGEFDINQALEEDEIQKLDEPLFVVYFPEVIKILAEEEKVNAKDYKEYEEKKAHKQ